jgi:hypothetical protein
MPVFRRHPSHLVVASQLLLSCSTFRNAMEPAVPFTAEMPAPGQIPDSVLRRTIHRAELIVLGTPQELASQHGFLTPQFQLGAKETWYYVRLAVDSVIKGKLSRAKRPDLGALPAWLTPPLDFRLARNEIVVQYPVVTTTKSDWAAAAPLVVGERAVFLFRRCYYCLPITGLVTGRGGYYKASPLVAVGRESKLPPDDWPRIVRLLVEQHRKRRG